MKNCFRYILLIAVIASFASCEKDNYTAPGSFLTGALTYKGDTIRVERNQVPYQLYQYGFGAVGPISGTFAQDGSYSQVLFNGNYKLIIPNGQGPFMWKQDASGNPDSLSITMSGSQNLTLEVTPFYMVRNAQFGYSASDSMVTATFKAEKIVTDPDMMKDIERVSLYVNNTEFTSGGDNIAFTNMAGGDITNPDNITLSVRVPFETNLSTFTQGNLYARVGIKMVNVEDMIFSDVEIVSIK